MNVPGRRRKIWAWALWDWGTQPYATVITTFVFSVYLTSSAFGSETSTSLALSLSTGLAGLAIAALAPVLGQRSDRNGRRMRSLRVMTWLLALVSALLFFVRPDPSYLWLGLVLLGVGSVFAEIGNVNYYALLDDLTTQDDVGRVSGFGWGLGYLGGIIMLLVLFFGLISPEVGWFGVTDANGMNIRVSMLLCALWTLLFTIPLFLAVRDKPRLEKPKHLGVVGSYKALWKTIVDLWNTDRQTAYFMLASALFRDGLAGVFTFGAIIAAGTFRLSAGEVIIFGAVANVVAGVATILFGYLDDWIGPKKVIMISLISLVLVGISVFVFGRMAALGEISVGAGKTSFWVSGLLLTVFVGPAQSASRSFLARIVPDGKSGELFGLYVTTGRAVSFFAPAAFGLAVLVGQFVTKSENTQYWGILGIVLVLAAGALTMVPVKEGRTATQS